MSYICLQGMPYSPVKFTGAPDAQCLQGMPYSPVKFTGAPDAQCLQGMPCSPVKFTGHNISRPSLWIFPPFYFTMFFMMIMIMDLSLTPQ